MTIYVSGLKELMRAYDGVEDVIRKEAQAVLNNNLSDMVKHARRDHRFTTRTGMGEKSIQKSVSKGRKGRSFGKGKISINPRFSAVRWRGKKVSYMVFQHEGTYSGYKKSPIAPSLPSSSGRGGIRHDHFLWRAVKRYRKRLSRELNEIPGEVKKYFRRGGR